jgi:hypothetical protein
VFFQTLDIALNGVTNIRHRLVARFPLGNTAGQSRAFGNKNAVFIRFNRDTKFHTASVAIGGAAGNATVAIVSPTEDSGRYNTTGVRGKEEEG